MAHALRRRSIAATLVFTGQHPALDPADHGLDGYPSLRLACPGLPDPHMHVGSVTKALIPWLSETDLAIVQGDTSSALGGALAAAMAGVSIAHVEAGLRSHDRRRPWPEEEFRIAIDGHADLLFAPTDLSAANLRRERVKGEIHITGNTGIDAALAVGKPLRQPKPGKGARKRLLVTCHRRESWGEGLAAIAAALRTIAGEAIDVDFVLHPNPAVASQMRLLLATTPGIRLLAPCGHRELLEMIIGSDLVLSDSGGIQEECAALGVPLLVLRERSERPEAIACGNMRLVGTDTDGIADSVQRLIGYPELLSTMRVKSLPYGDGRAGERIAGIVRDWLAERTELGKSEERNVIEAAE